MHNTKHHYQIPKLKKNGTALFREGFTSNGMKMSWYSVFSFLYFIYNQR